MAASSQDDSTAGAPHHTHGDAGHSRHGPAHGGKRGGHHHHHHIDPDAGDLRVGVAIAVNILLTVAQIVGGVISGSLALIADAIHNFSDAMALVIAFAARKIARRRADETMTFGYGRAEIVAAQINITTLIILGLYLIYEAAMRFIDPQPVDGWLVVIIAGVALVIDAVTAALTFQLSKTSVNIRAAFLHNLADALGSIAVIVAGVLILLFDWRIIDPIVTLGIAAYILWMAMAEIGGIVRILMLGSPPNIDTRAVLAAVRDVDGVADVHLAHFWQLGEHQNAFDAHVAVKQGCWSRADSIKADVKTVLRERFGIDHATLELECAAHACSGAREVGDA